MEVPSISDGKSIFKELSKRSMKITDKKGLCSIINDQQIVEYIQNDQIYTEFIVVNAEIQDMSAESRIRNDNEMRLYLVWTNDRNEPNDQLSYYHSISNFTGLNCVSSTEDNEGYLKI